MLGRSRVAAARKEAMEACETSTQSGSDLRDAITESRAASHKILERFMRAEDEKNRSGPND